MHLVAVRSLRNVQVGQFFLVSADMESTEAVEDAVLVALVELRVLLFVPLRRVDDEVDDVDAAVVETPARKIAAASACCIVSNAELIAVIPVAAASSRRHR